MKEWIWAHAKMLIGIAISTIAIKGGGIVGKIMGTMGLAFITYHYVMPEIRMYLSGLVSGLSAEAYNLVTYCNVDKGMTLVVSAGATKIASKLMMGKVGS
jgi:hypothetical protein